MNHKVENTSSKTRHELQIDLAEHSYSIVLGEDLLQEDALFSEFKKSSQAMIVTNVTIAPLYAERLQATLTPLFSHVRTIVLPDGEVYKNWDSLNTIFTQLLENMADRQTTLFALGGGVIGDMTGFAAACYMRGVPYVQVPTTLLAQVDSSVGGKTAINHPLGKNMIGAFYQPKKVIADISTLRTLPERELYAGLAEVIKYGIIYDASFFCWLEDRLEDLLALNNQAMMYAVQRSCEIKAEIVTQDEKESGLRAILNLGHTFGHAIEAGAGYGVWLHGEAVGCGMLMAADLSVRLGQLSQADFTRIEKLITRAHLPVKAPPLGTAEYLKLMQKDKKNQAGSIRYVLLDSLGKAVVQTAPENLVCDVLNVYQA